MKKYKENCIYFDEQFIKILKGLDKGYYIINMYYKVKTSYIGDLYILDEGEKNLDLVKTKLGYRNLLSIIIKIGGDQIENIKLDIFGEISDRLFYLLGDEYHLNKDFSPKFEYIYIEHNKFLVINKVDECIFNKYNVKKRGSSVYCISSYEFKNEDGSYNIMNPSMKDLGQLEQETSTSIANKKNSNHIRVKGNIKSKRYFSTSPTLFKDSNYTKINNNLKTSISEDKKVSNFEFNEFVFAGIVDILKNNPINSETQIKLERYVRNQYTEFLTNQDTPIVLGVDNNILNDEFNK